MAEFFLLKILLRKKKKGSFSRNVYPTAFNRLTQDFNKKLYFLINRWHAFYN